MANVFLKISNEDRVGLVLDISDILCRRNINILSMEVHPNIIYLEIQSLDAMHELDLSTQLKTIPYVKDVQKIADANSLPHQQASTISCGDPFDVIVYRNNQMQRIIALARRVASINSTVILRGESGTGKELFAKAIHSSSQRNHHHFVPINCAALPESLLESELFGYDEGAFTGASKHGKKGLFEYADGGTLFLDEIGELPLSLQAKLLRVLQEGKLKRVGSNYERSVDVRIIVATHCNLEEMVLNKQFREDLYYRLNVIPIELPPLRDRKEDLPVLVESLLQKKCQQLGREHKTMVNSAMDKLLQHHWPGNVRELENILERAVCLSSKSVITVKDICLDSKPLLLTTHQQLLNSENGKPKKLKELLNELEHEILLHAIKKYNTSRQVGKMLGLSHTGVLNRIKKHKICHV